MDNTNTIRCHVTSAIMFVGYTGASSGSLAHPWHCKVIRTMAISWRDVGYPNDDAPIMEDIDDNINEDIDVGDGTWDIRPLDALAGASDQLQFTTDAALISAKIGISIKDLVSLPLLDVTAGKRIERFMIKVRDNLFNFM
ncbi:hypothetical protein FNV43_RR10458 [Rhamnella rubrinervis]|uniref:Uncharacterized protein n=1 Tax=Rhamnella rubrinervis TaxID=2594499 RepID=A0A8K0HBX1_9ROSA|nr:hypothetical protein FNV43_RR10458 [Rhamnella rubrinervis]